MTNRMMLSEAKRLAGVYHSGQVDLCGSPMYSHVRRVAEYAEKQAKLCQYLDEDVEICVIVAWLHDIVEDTNLTLDGLKAYRFSNKVVNAVDSVTRREGESYKNFVMRAEENHYGIIVKHSDIRDHLDISRFNKLTCNDIGRFNKYLKWYKYLNNKLLEKY